MSEIIVRNPWSAESKRVVWLISLITSAENTASDVRKVNLSVSDCLFYFQADFDAKLEAAGDLLVLVDFHATWCGPCKMIAPKLEEFANTYADKLVIVKVCSCKYQMDPSSNLNRFHLRSMLMSARISLWSTTSAACRRSSSSRRVRRSTASVEQTLRNSRSSSSSTLHKPAVFAINRTIEEENFLLWPCKRSISSFELNF